MAEQFTSILPEHEEFIKKQRIFFVGSAPSFDGHINLSPKGYDVLRIISPTRVAYLDLTGSGNETSAHLIDNGRITFMFVAFEGPPMILRLYGKGRVIVPGMPEWDEQAGHFDLLPGARQIIMANIHEVKTSCGFGVPFYSYTGERNTLQQWAINKGEQGLAAYWKEKNLTSMDGLITTLGQEMIEPNVRSPIKNRVGGVFIPVRDIKQARDWYCKILGLPADGDIMAGHLYSLPMEGTGITLDQMPKWGGNEPEGPPAYQTPAFMFQSDDIDASYQFMKDNGVELVTEIENSHWFAFRDPDGNLLMVCK